MKSFGKFLLRLIIIEVIFSTACLAMDAIEQGCERRRKRKTTVDEYGNICLGEDDYTVD